ncbi:MAG: hypothetical protein QM765_24905 [Myxococcales bacterium]
MKNALGIVAAALLAVGIAGCDQLEQQGRVGQGGSGQASSGQSHQGLSMSQQVQEVQQSSRQQQAFGGLQQPGMVSGTLSQANANQLVIRVPGQGSATLQITGQTQVTLDGKQVSFDQLMPGIQVRASYQVQQGQATATRIRRGLLAGGPAAEPAGGVGSVNRQGIERAGRAGAPALRGATAPRGGQAWRWTCSRREESRSTSSGSPSGRWRGRPTASSTTTRSPASG